MHRNKQGWIDQYKKKGALWIHDGNPERPHALLTSGNHSNGFFNSKPVIADEPLLKEAAEDLLKKFNSSGDIWDIEVVVGPQTGGTKLAELIAKTVEKQTSIGCRFASPAKDNTGGVKSMVFTEEEKLIIRGKKCLLGEDVLTTGGSVELAAKAITDAGGSILPFILVLVNRSGKEEVSGKKIIALIDEEMPIWEPANCPLCKDGSLEVRPKDHWDILNAEY